MQERTKASARAKKRKKRVAVVDEEREKRRRTRRNGGGGWWVDRGEEKVSSGKNGRRTEEKIKGKTVRMKM